MSGPGLVALPGFDDRHLAGAVVAWSLSGTTDIKRLQELWRAAGLMIEDLPAPPSAEVALRRALNGIGDQRRFVSSLKKRGAWALVDEHATEDDLTHHVTLKVTLDPFSFTPPDHPLIPAIEEAFTSYMATLETQDVSAWLVKQADKLQAVSLRSSGGFYFIPPSSMLRWRTICHVLKESGKHELVEIPAVKTDGVLDAVVGAMVREADALITEIQEDVGEFTPGDLGSRALRTRQSRCDQAASKVAGYETLLGRKMTAVSDRLQELKAKVMEAALQAEALEEQERVSA